jgi:AAA ATPase domain
MLFGEFGSQPQTINSVTKRRPVVVKPAFPDYRREYRLVSVLYIRLIPAIRIEDEEWLNASTTAMQRLHVMITEHHGHFRRLSCSTAVAYFGYPAANEFATKLAVDAGLRANQFVATELNYIGVSSAVHTAVMITGQGYALPDITGECTAIARNLAEHGAVGTLLATEETLNGIASFFDVIPAIGVSHTAFSVQTARKFCIKKSCDPYQTDCFFVGRAHELHELEFAWEKASLVGGANVLLTGGAGIGKSCLSHQFFASRQMSQGDVYWARFLPEYAFSPLHPILALVRSFWNIQADSLQEFECKVTRALAEVGLSDKSAVQLLARLLRPHGETIQKLSSFQREKLFSIIAVSLTKFRQTSLITLVIENVQWADTLSLDFIAWFRERTEQYRTFLLITSRKYPHVLGNATRLDTNIELVPFNEDEATSLAIKLLPQFADRPLPWQRRMLEMTDGIPLYIQKMTASVIENSNETADLTVPTSLRNQLMSQIDQLSEVRQTLCHASCIGRKFSLQVLATIESISTLRCRQLIKKMVAAELIEELSTPDQFQFCHMLIREVAYSTLTSDDRCI